MERVYSAPLYACVMATTVLAAACDDTSPAEGELPCEVVIEHVRDFGADAGANGPSESSRARLANGLLFVTHTYEKGTISVFDSGGRFVRAIGRHGSGPGELQNVNSIVVHGDTAYVSDRERRGVEVFHANGTYIRNAARLSGYTPFTALPGGSVVLLSGIRGGGNVTAHIIQSDTTTFEISNEGIAANEGLLAIMAPFDASSFWLGFDQRYLFERYTVQGDRVARVAADISWFPPASEFRTNRENQDTISVVSGFAVDDMKRLIVFILTNPFTPQRPRGRLDQPLSDIPSTARIHVFDSIGNPVAVWEEENSKLKGLADGRHAYAFDTLEDGTPVIRLSRVYLTKPNTLEGCQ